MGVGGDVEMTVPVTVGDGLQASVTAGGVNVTVVDPSEHVSVVTVDGGAMTGGVVSTTVTVSVATPTANVEFITSSAIVFLPRGKVAATVAPESTGPAPLIC